MFILFFSFFFHHSQPSGQQLSFTIVLDTDNKDRDNAVHASIFPSDHGADVSASLPEAPRRRVPSARRLLRDCACCDVLVLHLVGLALREFLCALLDDSPGPLVDFLVLEDLLTSHRVHDGSTGDVLHKLLQALTPGAVGAPTTTTAPAAIHCCLCLCVSAAFFLFDFFFDLSSLIFIM